MIGAIGPLANGYVIGSNSFGDGHKPVTSGAMQY